MQAGETSHAGAEGATAPETLRQKDRAQTALWKAAAAGRRLTEGVDPVRRVKSLRSRDRGGEGREKAVRLKVTEATMSEAEANDKSCPSLSGDRFA